MTVHEQLYAAYKASGLTVASIAAEAGVSDNTIRRFLYHGRNVNVETVMAIACVLEVRAVEVPRR